MPSNEECGRGGRLGINRVVPVRQIINISVRTGGILTGNSQRFDFPSNLQPGGGIKVIV
jgi:hypothetical protein